MTFGNNVTDNSVTSIVVEYGDSKPQSVLMDRPQALNYRVSSMSHQIVRKIVVI